MMSSRILLACSVLCLLLLTQCQPRTGADRGQDADITVVWGLDSNVAGGGSWCHFVLRNDGSAPLADTGWALFFNMSPRTIIDSTISGPVSIGEVLGDFYRLSPRSGFKLDPGDSVLIRYYQDGWMIKNADAPVGVYLATGSGEAARTQPVARYRVEPFTRLSLRQLYPREDVPAPDASFYFSRYERMLQLPEQSLPHVLPTPDSVGLLPDGITLQASWPVHFDAGLENEASWLSARLRDLLGTAPKLVSGKPAAANAIYLTQMPGGSPESYTLSINPANGVRIAGADAAGVFYGIQSLLHLAPAGAYAKASPQLPLPGLVISDGPAFAYRGMHIDVARNFSRPETLKRLMDVMALYKLNKLHLHLTDDEGWRLEIKSLPELTEVGARRGHTFNSNNFLSPAYGSGPNPEDAESYGNGYYTQETLKDLLRYASVRHIQVIPEINFPGHARAAIKAMDNRYRRLKAEGKEAEALQYLLSDPLDSSQYTSAQNYHDNVVCVCRESVYAFYEKVVDEVVSLYREAGHPLDMIHTGGDEVPRGVWTRSPICLDFLNTRSDIRDPANLQSYFFGRIAAMLKAKGLKSGGWEEVAMTFLPGGGWKANPQFAGGDVVPYVWNSLGENLDLGNRLANGGYPVVLCNVTNFYFDLAVDHHPEEPGLYWGGFVDARDAFRFSPYNVFLSSDEDDLGRPVPASRFNGLQPLRSDARSRILGLQAELWSETIRGQDRLESYYLPRLIAFAERAWVGEPLWTSISDPAQRRQAEDLAWNRVANAIGQRELPRLAYFNGGYPFHIAPPGARIENGQLRANYPFPGTVIRYSTDGQDPDANSKLYEGPVSVSGTVRLRAFDARGRGSRVVSVN